MIMPKTTKKAAARTTTAKKPTTHKKKTAAKAVKAPVLRSFRLSRDPQPFMTSTPSIQSLYWAIIGALVLAFVAWAMFLTAQIQAIYDSVMTADTSSYMTIKK
jgi:hypothetical protein